MIADAIEVGAEVPESRRARCLRLFARTAAKLPAGESLVRYQCRRMVELAIRRAERELVVGDPLTNPTPHKTCS